MGAGSSSVKNIGMDELALPCPLFYNYMPNPNLVPTATLPTRGPGGQVRRPPGGCAARVIALSALPVVSEAAKIQAKQVVAEYQAGKKARQGPPEEARSSPPPDATALATANAVLNNPSVPPSLSSCFLVNIAVDDAGRPAPLATDGLPTTDNTATSTGGSGGAAGNAGSGAAGTALAGPSCNPCSAPPPLRKGFSFSLSPNPNQRKPQNGTGDGPASPDPEATKGSPGREAPESDPSRARIVAGVEKALHTSGLTDPPRSPPSANPLSIGRDASQGSENKPGSLKSCEQPSALRHPSFSEAAGDAASGKSRVEESEAASAVAGVHPVLVKDSHFRKSESYQSRRSTITSPPTVLNDSDGAALPRLRRQLSKRTILLNVPQQTRWFLFNDSSTHEAYLTMQLCYEVKQGEAPGLPNKIPTDSEEHSTKAPKAASKPVEGEFRVVCEPTSHVSSAISRKEIKRQVHTGPALNRSYVELHHLSVQAFLTTLSASASALQREQVSELKHRATHLAAVLLFVAVAPGETVFFAEGEALAYKIDTQLVPFKRLDSITVVGHLLTSDQATKLKREGEAAASKGCRHTLMYIANSAVNVPETHLNTLESNRSFDGNNIFTSPPPNRTTFGIDEHDGDHRADALSSDLLETRRPVVAWQADDKTEVPRNSKKANTSATVAEEQQVKSSSGAEVPDAPSKQGTPTLTPLEMEELLDGSAYLLAARRRTLPPYKFLGEEETKDNAVKENVDIFGGLAGPSADHAAAPTGGSAEGCGDASRYGSSYTAAGKTQKAWLTAGSPSAPAELALQSFTDSEDAMKVKAELSFSSQESRTMSSAVSLLGISF